MYFALTGYCFSFGSSMGLPYSLPYLASYDESNLHQQDIIILPFMPMTNRLKNISHRKTRLLQRFNIFRLQCILHSFLAFSQCNQCPYTILYPQLHFGMTILFAIFIVLWHRRPELLDIMHQTVKRIPRVWCYVDILEFLFLLLWDIRFYNVRDNEYIQSTSRRCGFHDIQRFRCEGEQLIGRLAFNSRRKCS